MKRIKQSKRQLQIGEAIEGKQTEKHIDTQTQRQRDRETEISRERDGDEILSDIQTWTDVQIHIKKQQQKNPIKKDTD